MMTFEDASESDSLHLICSEAGVPWFVTKALEMLYSTNDATNVWFISNLGFLPEKTLMRVLSNFADSKLYSILEDHNQIEKVSALEGDERSLAILGLLGVQAPAATPKLSWQPPSLPSEMQAYEIATRVEREIRRVAIAVPQGNWVKYALALDARALDGLFGFVWQWYGYLLSESQSPEMRAKFASASKVNTVGVLLCDPYANDIDSACITLSRNGRSRVSPTPTAQILQTANSIHYSASSALS